MSSITFPQQQFLIEEGNSPIVEGDEFLPATPPNTQQMALGQTFGDCKTLQNIYQQLNGNDQQIINALTEDCCSINFVTCIGPAITALQLSSMNLNGNFPQSVTDLKSLQVLDLSFNPIGGTLPSNINELTHLYWLSIASTNINGDLPAAIGTMGALKFLVLSRTQIWGGIPFGLQNLQSL